MSKRRDLLVPKSRDAVFIHRSPMNRLSMLVSLLGVLKVSPGRLLPGLVILFIVGFRGSTMRVRGAILQLGSSLMIFVMRSVLVTRRHN
jgi:hypothetical protein